MAPGLLALSGVGNLIAARLLAEAGGPGRFATDAQLARHAGCAPIEVASGRCAGTGYRAWATTN
jgi:transposase